MTYPIARRVAMLSLLCFSVAKWALVQADSAAATPATHKVYMGLLNPREYPDDARRSVKPPTYETFGNRTQFVALRSFPQEGDLLVRYKEELDTYTKTYELGNVVWPAYPVISAKNLGELADEIHSRGLFLFDVWGYVPGSGPNGYWQQFKPAPGASELLESKLGDHWLGMDNGEQDGRYVGGYAVQANPVSTDRLEQYYHFQRHFEQMGDELGNKLSALVSLNFGHYFLKEGQYTLIGAETAQGLPNGQVFYSFIRGAGKQYGVLWFGNASVWNRWGYKTYDDEGKDHGPTHGTSLNLLKRLLYSQILYNSAFVGFESSWIGKDGLTPVGKIQRAANHWVAANGNVGVMQTPIALLLDFHAGWTFPRQLYTDKVYRAWGSIPYLPGDYLTDNVIDMIYPGYQDSAYFHDERGFIAPTPYGDSADCLLSDAEGWLLNRYPVVVAAGELDGGVELRDKLQAYVEQGGHLVITAGNLKKSVNGIGGISVVGSAKAFDVGQEIVVGGTSVREEHPFELATLSLPAEATVLARCGDAVAAARITLGKGRITVIASPFGVSTQPAVTGIIKAMIDQTLPKPYPILSHVRAVIDAALRETVLFDAGNDLSVITCRKGAGDYTIGVCNNALDQKPLVITSQCGAIQSLEEIPLDQVEKGAAGYVPAGSEGAQLGVSGKDTIAGGDVRLFHARVAETDVVEIPHVVPPARPRLCALRMRGARTIKEYVLARPTFFEHARGVIVDWRYVHERDAAALAQEAGWIKRQGLRVIVDLTSGMNLYPDIRLMNNSDEHYAASRAIISDVLTKMQVLGAHDLVLSKNRLPENNMETAEANAAFVTGLRDVCTEAQGHDITLYFRVTPMGAWSIDAALGIIAEINTPNLKFAASLATLKTEGRHSADAAQAIRDRVGLWLVSAPELDAASRPWTMQGRVVGHEGELDVKGWLALVPDAPVVLDGVYANWDEEYLDLKAIANPVSI